jgi:hypothetical protein
MSAPNVSALVAVCSSLALEKFGEHVVTSELEELVRDVLFGSRALWAASNSGLITSAEVANAIADRFLVWLSARTGRSLAEASRGEWEGFLSNVEAALRA